MGEGPSLDRTNSFAGVPGAGGTVERLEKINEGGMDHEPEVVVF